MALTHHAEAPPKEPFPVTDESHLAFYLTEPLKPSSITDFFVESPVETSSPARSDHYR